MSTFSDRFRGEMTPELERLTAGLGDTDVISLRRREAGDVDLAWREVALRTQAPAVAVQAEASARHATLRRTPRWRLVAGIGVACAAIGMVAVTATKSILPSSGSAQQAMVDVSTATGEQTQIPLPDGSTVLLNVGSTLRYAQDYGKDTRDIYLDGEALFTVTKQSHAPFVVHAGGHATRVLGTSFTVRKYEADPSVRVVVAEGKVEVANAILTTGDAAFVGRDGAATVSHHVDIATALAWTKKELVFTRTPLQDVIPELERWYGMTVQVEDPVLLDATVTTKLTTQYPAQIADVLARILDCQVTKAEAGFLLTSR